MFHQLVSIPNFLEKVTLTDAPMIVSRHIQPGKLQGRYAARRSASNVGGRGSIARPLFTNRSRRQLFTSRQLLVRSYTRTTKRSSIGMTSFTSAFVGADPSFMNVSVMQSKFSHAV